MAPVRTQPKLPTIPAEPSSPSPAAAIASLNRLASAPYRAGLARYAIPADRAWGVPVGKIQTLAKSYKRTGDPESNHSLCLDLWKWGGGWYEARMLCCFLDDPALVTAAQMDRWCRDFDSWAICDTACFHLFDKVAPALAFRKIHQWSRLKGEFQKRTAFALLASLALHLKPRDAEHDAFLDTLALIEKAASDDRNFVKKGVSWALRGVGRRNPDLHIAAMKLAKRLAASANTTERWIGKDALKDLLK
jgi:3-methyladenine DNA glycosylase AlkD